MNYSSPTYLKLSSVRTITPNANSIITLEEAKAHLRVNFDDDDNLISDLIDTASNVVSRSIGKPLLETTLGIEKHERSTFKELYIPIANLIAVDDVLIDSETIDQSEYAIVYGGDDQLPFIKFKKRQLSEDSLSVIFRAGYNPLPKQIKQAALLYIGHLYQNTDLVAKGTSQQPYELPFTIDVLLAPFYNIGIYGAEM